MKGKCVFCIVLLLLIVSCKKKSTQPNYTNFKILKITLLAMPFSDENGEAWDPLYGDPDVFFNMEGGRNIVLYEGISARCNDVTKNDLPLSWDFINAYQITNIDVTQFVTVYDYDSLDPNDLIGYIGFTLSDHKSNYPKRITKSNSTGLTVSISGEWY